MQTESKLQAIQERMDRHDALVLPWIEMWREMGYGAGLDCEIVRGGKGPAAAVQLVSECSPAHCGPQRNQLG